MKAIGKLIQLLSLCGVAASLAMMFGGNAIGVLVILVSLVGFAVGRVGVAMGA